MLGEGEKNQFLIQGRTYPGEVLGIVPGKSEAGLWRTLKVD